MSIQPSSLVACHGCDAVYQRHEIPVGAKADCHRCGSELYRHIDNSLDRSLALYLATLVLMVIANFYPFLSMQTAGIKETSLVYSGGFALYEFGMAEIGVVVFLTSILFPFICVVGMLYLLIPLRFGRLPGSHGRVYRWVKSLEPWSLLSVFMLGTLIAIVKLQSLASVVPGLGMWAFVVMLITYSAARANFDPEVLWAHSKVLQATTLDLAIGAEIATCHSCGLIRPLSEDKHRCDRCGGTLHHRLVESIERTWALLISAAIMLIPANLYPVMTVKKLGQGSPDTILSGVIHLIEAGMYGLALIVLFASILVPLLKLTVLSYLLYSSGSGSSWRPKDRTRLYRITEVVGAWSMVDVFLVGLLSGLVSLGLLATIEPGIGASFFAGAVILTMLAAHSFDPRLIWDGARRQEAGNTNNNNNEFRTT